MDEQQIRELAAQGIDFGSHTLTHPRLTSLYRRGASAGDRRFEAKARRAAGPAGELVLLSAHRLRRARPRARPRAGYRSACGGEQAANSRYLIHRINVSQSSWPATLFRIWGWRYALQRSGGLRRLRHALLPEATSAARANGGAAMTTMTTTTRRIDVSASHVAPADRCASRRMAAARGALRRPDAVLDLGMVRRGRPVSPARTGRSPSSPCATRTSCWARALRRDALRRAAPAPAAELRPRPLLDSRLPGPPARRRPRRRSRRRSVRRARREIAAGTSFTSRSCPRLRRRRRG